MIVKDTKFTAIAVPITTNKAGFQLESIWRKCRMFFRRDIPEISNPDAKMLPIM